jgi:hypothetical protein
LHLSHRRLNADYTHHRGHDCALTTPTGLRAGFRQSLKLGFGSEDSTSCVVRSSRRGDGIWCTEIRQTRPSRPTYNHQFSHRLKRGLIATCATSLRPLLTPHLRTPSPSVIGTTDKLGSLPRSPHRRKSPAPIHFDGLETNYPTAWQEGASGVVSIAPISSLGSGSAMTWKVLQLETCRFR